MNRKIEKHQTRSATCFLNAVRLKSPRLLRIASLCVLLAGVCTQSWASLIEVNLGVIGIGVPASPGTFQQVLVFNQTQQDCTTASGPFALVCGGVNLTDWTVTIDYTVGVGGLAAAPVSNSSAECLANGGLPGCETLVPGNNPILDPLFILPYGPPGGDIITRIVFTASVSGPLSVFSAAGGAMTLHPDSPFTTTVVLADSGTAGTRYLNGTIPFFYTDLLVSGEDFDPVAVPEPSTLIMLFGGALVLGVRRFLRH